MLSDKKEGTGTNRSRTPNSKEFLDYISSGWQESSEKTVAPSPSADFAKTRRDQVAAEFPGQLILIEAGAPRPDQTTQSIATDRMQHLLT